MGPSVLRKSKRNYMADIDAGVQLLCAFMEFLEMKKRLRFLLKDFLRSKGYSSIEQASSFFGVDEHKARKVFRLQVQDPYVLNNFMSQLDDFPVDEED